MKFNEVEKKRFKLYKAGKMWLIAGTTFLALAGLGSVAVHADSNNLNTQSAQSTVATNQDVKVESTQSQDNNVVTVQNNDVTTPAQTDSSKQDNSATDSKNATVPVQTDSNKQDNSATDSKNATVPVQTDSNKQDNSATDSKNATVPAQTDSNKQDNSAADSKNATVPAQTDSNKQDNSAAENKDATPAQTDSNKQDNSATDNKNAAGQANSTSVNSDTTSNTNANNQKVALLAADNQTDGWNTDHTQYTQGGQLLTGVHNIDGTYYDFDENHNIVKNNYVQSQWGLWYMFGNDGRIATKVTPWAGTYYYFDPSTYLRVDNDYRQSQWGSWYMFGNDGRIATKVTPWAGTYYYFDPSTYLRVDNDYRQSQWGSWYMFGNDGRIATKVTPWAGTYYYFDPSTYLRVDNDYRQSQWGSWYLFGNDGRVQSGVQRWSGTYYYFDPTTYLRVDDDYVTSQWGLKYMFGKDGRIVSDLYKWDKKNQWYYFDPVTYLAVTNNYIKANDGNWYLFTADGTAASKVAPWSGTYYYFDPVTHLRVDNDYVQSQWGDWYMFGNDGRIVTGPVTWYGSNYYFDPTTYLKVTNRWINDKYYGSDGRQAVSQSEKINNKFYYFDENGSIIRNQFKKINGGTYYFGDDGAALIGLHVIDGKNYNFASDGQLLGKTYGKIENGKFNIYDATSNKLLKTLDSGDWENLADSFDSSSINNIDGYLSYADWYRPYGTSQDGKTWHKTTASDWRPLLMYVYPSKDVEAKYIKYFVSNGYTSTDYGLTKDNVANLSQDTDSATLNKYARNLRFVIEKSIAINKSTSPLANDINKFMTTIPELSAKSELPSYSQNDQLVFVNNNSSNQAKGNTSYADSNYRLMDRTLNNQTNNDSSDHSPEMLLGNDIDNSNPVVQAENLNWEYFLLNYGKLMQYNANGNFDGFRVDAADHIDADVLDQLGQLMNDLYHTKGNQVNANSHLVYNEGYNYGDVRMLNGKNNPALYLDSGYWSQLESSLGRNADKRDSISNLMTNSIVNRANDVTENTAMPNWSFVTNHDQRNNLVNRIVYDKNITAQKAWDMFYADQVKTDKQYAQYNMPAQYALLLSNKDTVPQVYYGDLYNETDQYMKTKSMYYDAITTLMKARRTFVNGGQTMTKLNNNLIASVRYGKGVSDVSDKGTDSLSRTTGMAVIVGNNPAMSEQVVQINMGVAHANEQYRSLINSTDNGLTYDGMGSAFLTTDSKGILRVTVKGYSNPYVNGYLSVWVPVISGTQNAQTNAQEVHNVLGKTFASNAALDAHMIYQDFSLAQPEPTTINNHAYNVIKANASLFNQLGITDFWMAPAYMPFSSSKYQDGYSTTDHYNLGTTDNPTKYGSGEELANAIAALHQEGLKVQEDLVMNQMFGFPSQEAVTVTRADEYGKQFNVDGQTFANQIYFGYTRGGGQGQQDYGGKYLGELNQKYPDLFTTKAASSGVAPDPNTRITEWSAKYENGTSLQNIGVGLAIKMPNGYYAYLNNGSNKTFNTTLPDAIASTDYYANKANL
ncbi:glycoside hydrolase family 70 protein [Fructilactobacillus sanfranciscensis]|uniref:glycoside hydrolase family 70 protein n=1 Tax=Fructilactobacillus sanfranciscensis TaxID=1625 RepID=UPI0023AB1B22|nr:glycoside hydrolase family 70 protein [Fructilactobacillus sanfranciscensis]WED57507.1 glycoside hydrolase family 70 protein [Fructilactobacillus sanfranciscensis]